MPRETTPPETVPQEAVPQEAAPQESVSRQAMPGRLSSKSARPEPGSRESGSRESGSHALDQRDPVPTDAPTGLPHINSGFVSRLILGALTEHEQRLLAIRLLHADAKFRLHLHAHLEPFEMFDDDLLTAYAYALETHDGDDLVVARRRLLAKAYERAPDLGVLVRAFTFGDLLRLGDATRRLFSWSMAEHLLERGTSEGSSGFNVRTHLYLALMVVDVVEILGAGGHSPYFPAVVSDVRRRIQEAYGPWIS